MVKVKIEAKIAYIDIKFFLSKKVYQKFGYVVNVFYLCGSESPLISFAVGGMEATQHKANNYLNKLCSFFKLLYICTYL